MSALPGDGGPAWVLAVDDDSRVLEAIQLALETLGGLRVCVATDADSALECLAGARPAVVVLDLGLPGTDVERLVSGLRAELGEALPLFIISADEHVEARAVKLGAYGFLAKPFGPEELLAGVRKGLDRAAPR